MNESRNVIELNKVYLGDCLRIMSHLPDNIVSTILTDPPYSLNFMNKEWDNEIAFNPEVWREALRVAKPGATLMAFGGTRTYHRLACAIEDAGWEIRDCINYLHDGSHQEAAFMASLNEEQLAAYLELHKPNDTMFYLYGSGFPKAKRVTETADRFVSKGDVCQCADNMRNTENTYPLRYVLSRICKVGTLQLMGHDAYSNGHYEKGILLNSQDDYHGESHSCDESLRRAARSVLAFLQPQEYAQEHNRFSLPSDDQDSLSLRNLYRALCNDLRANMDYFRLLQSQPVLQSLQECEGESIPLSDWRETLNKLVGSLDFSVLMDCGKEVFRSVHIYNLVFCLPLSVLRILNSREYKAIIPQIMVCGNCDKIYNTWSGYTSCGLKPSFEPIVVAQKPIDQSYAHNAEVWGVSGIWIDGGRIGANGEKRERKDSKKQNSAICFNGSSKVVNVSSKWNLGRWPANTIHDSNPQVLREFDKAGVRKTGNTVTRNTSTFLAKHDGRCGVGYIDDNFSASRFFYSAKASPAERSTPGNNHPTQKPLSLMKYLCRITRPPDGGIVLDPFAGSGTTALACIAENRDYILIEKEPDYVEICNRRIAEYTGQEIEVKEIEISEDQKVKQLSLW